MLNISCIVLPIVLTAVVLLIVGLASGRPRLTGVGALLLSLTLLAAGLLMLLFWLTASMPRAHWSEVGLVALLISFGGGAALLWLAIRSFRAAKRMTPPDDADDEMRRMRAMDVK